MSVQTVYGTDFFLLLFKSQCRDNSSPTRTYPLQIHFWAIFKELQQISFPVHWNCFLLKSTNFRFIYNKAVAPSPLLSVHQTHHHPDDSEWSMIESGQPRTVCSSRADWIKSISSVLLKTLKMCMAEDEVKFYGYTEISIEAHVIAVWRQSWYVLWDWETEEQEQSVLLRSGAVVLGFSSCLERFE